MKTGSQNPIPKRYQIITWLNIITQVSFPLACTFSPAIASSSTIPSNKFLSNNDQFVFRQTQIYRLKEGESTHTIVAKYNISLEALRKLNQFRTFAHPFEKLQPGDELDIPMAALPTIKWDDEKIKQVSSPAYSAEEMKFAQLASQTGKFLANKPNKEAAETLVRNLATSTASHSIQEWLNRGGNAQIRLDADKNLSLKNSQFDLLLPLHETKDRLAFTQWSLHNTDNRLQTNIGLGVRWFGDKQMIGGNSFFDYDISRGHSRLGLGAEYRRDFLKLSANSYHPLSQWKNSKDLDDHMERPSHGWDVRAEGWLPIYPQLGGKLTYEQYYGDNVALFGTKNLQHNPSAMTIGINYTPFPLLTLNAEQRRGKSKKRDSRIGLNINYYLNKSWKQHLDSDAVSNLRSLIGSRYDFVNRNNNIILQYRKNDVIYLSLNSIITGYAGEEKPLDITVSSQYGLDHINWSAPQMMASGGSIIDDKNGRYNIILPDYKTGAKAVNLYTVNAIAVDKKGNSSANASLQVIVSQPAVHSTQSTISPTSVTLSANGKMTQTLRLLVKDKAGDPIDVSASDIRLERTVPIKRAKRSTLIEEARGLSASRREKANISKFKRLAAGEYEAILTAGTKPETFSLTPIVRETVFSPIQITIAADKTTPQITPPTVNTTQPQVADGKHPVEIKVQLVDVNDNPLADTDVKWSTNKDPKDVTFKETVTKTDKDGFTTAIVDSKVSGDIKITATVDGAPPQEIDVTFIPDATTPSIKPNHVHVGNKETVADGKKPNVVEITVTDSNSNPLPNIEVEFKTDKGTLTDVKVTTDANGVAKTEITSTEAGDANITITVNGQDTHKTIEFISDKTTPQMTKPTVITAQPQVADGKHPVEIKVQLVDVNGNPLADTDVKWSTNKDPKDVTFKETVTKTDKDGFATAIVDSKVSGDIKITATIDGAPPQEIDVTFIPDVTTPSIKPNHVHVENKETIADGKKPNVVEITVTDSNGNPLPNIEVEFKTDKGTLTDVKVTTDANGVAKTEITSTEAGDANITITVNGQDTHKTIEFISDKTTPLVTKPTTNTRPQIADGKKPFEIKTLITDANGNPLADTEVKWQSGNTSGVVTTPNTTLTDKDGYATTQITSSVAGEVTVTATVNGATPQDIKVTFLPDTSTATIKQSDLVISHNSLVADGATANRIEVTVTDATGNKVPNADVEFKANKGNLKNTLVKTDANGIAKTELTSTVMGDAHVTITVGKNTVTGTINFIANSQTAKVDSVIPERKTTYLADGKTPIIYTAKIVDANNNPVANIDVDWVSNLTATELVFSSDTSRTNTLGIATVSVTSTKAAHVVVTATANNHSKLAELIEFVADKSKAQIAALETQKSTITANGGDTTIVTTQVTDNYGNPLEDVLVDFTSNRSTDTQIVALTPLFKTNKDGYVKAEVRTRKAADFIISTQVAGASSNKSIGIQAIADNRTASVLITSSKDTVQISQRNEEITLTATVQDAQKNPLVNTPVTWLSNKNQLNINTTMTNNQGQAHVKLSGYTSGETEVTAQLLNRSEEKTTIQFIAGEAKSQNSFLEIKPQTIVANNSEQATAIFTLKDQWDNPVIGKTTLWDSNNNAITISDIIEISNNKGVYQAKISGNQAGIFNITASADTISKQKILGFIADNSTAVINDISIIGNNSVQANGIGHITVRASIKDASGNPVQPNMPIGWRTEVGELVQPVSYTDVNGIAQITLTSPIAGKGKVTAILGKSMKETATDIEFLAGNVSSSASTVALTTPSIIADTGETEIVVTVTDDTSNRLHSLAQKITLAYTTDLGLTHTPFDDPKSTGTYRAKLKGIKTGNTEVSVNVDGVTLDNKLALTITPDPQTIRVRGDITTSTKNKIVGNTVVYSATFEDKHGNQLSAGIPIFWTANNGTQISSSQTTTNANGSSSITVQRNTVGDAEVTVNLTSQNSKAAPIVSFTQGLVDTNKVTLDLTPASIVAGKSTVLKMVLKDQFGNLLADQAPTIEIKSSNPEISIGPVTMTTLGNYQAAVTGNKAGTGTLTIKLSGTTLSQTKTVTVFGEKATWQVADLTTSTNTIKAGNNAGVVYTAKVVDQFNNPLPDVNVSWHLQGRADAFPHSSITNARGIAEVPVTSQHVGELVMTAVLSTNVEKKASAVKVEAGDINTQLSTFTANKTDIGPDNKEEVLFTVKLQDDFGNPIPNQIVVIESSLSQRDFIVQSITDHKDGRYSAKATAAISAAQKGSVKLTAKVNNKMIAKPIDIKIDAITPILSFDKDIKNITYSSAIDNGQAIKGLPNGFTPKWSSDNTSIAAIDNNGKVTLKKAGKTKIWARIDGNGVYKSAAVSYELDVEKAKPNLKLVTSKAMKARWDDGTPAKIEVAFNNADAARLPVEYISENSNIAQVDFRSGQITQIKPGKAKLTINSKETAQFLADSQEVTYDLAKASFKINFADAEKETTDQKSQFSLQHASAAVPPKAGAVWASDSNAVVDISKNGSINHLGKGKAKLTLAIKNNDYYEDAQGSYTTKVYAKPNLSSTHIVYRNNGKEEHSGTEWLPVYTDDSLTVNIPPIHYTEYDKPSKVDVLLKSGNRVLKTETLQDLSKHNAITFTPDKDYYKKDLIIEVNAPGKASLSLVANKKYDVTVEYIDPSKIGKIQTDYQPRYIVTDDNKDDKKNECAFLPTDWDRHFIIQPITKVDIGNNKELLVPLTIYHSVEKVNNNVDTFSFDNAYQITKSNRYKYDSIGRKHSVMSDCRTHHYGSGKLLTHLQFGDNSAIHIKAFDWLGTGKGLHSPSI